MRAEYGLRGRPSDISQTFTNVLRGATILSHRRIIFLFFAFLATLVGSTYYFLFRAGAATSFVEELIGKSIRRNLFALDAAEIDLVEGRLTIRNFKLSDPKKAGPDSPLLSVEMVQVELETNPLEEIGAVRRVSLHQLEINLSLAENQAPDFSQIFEQAGVSPPGTGEMPFPIITVTDSRVRLQLAPERPSILFQDLQLTIQPIDGEPDSIDLVGSMVSPLGHKITIRGGGNLQTRSFRTVLSLGNIPIKPEQAAVYQEEVRHYLDAAKVRGRIDKARIWMEYRDNSAAAPFRSGVAIEFSDLDIAPPYLPYLITGASGKLFAESSNGGRIRFELRQNSVNGNLTARGEIHRSLEADRSFDIHVHADDLLVGPRLLTAIDEGKISALKDFKAAFDPRDGRISGDIQISMKAMATKAHAIADLSFKGLTARFVGFPKPGGTRTNFPYPMHNVTGKIAIRPDAVILHSMTARDPAGALVTIHGQITELKTGRPRINLDVMAREITFSKALRQALESSLEDGAAIYDEYAPRGKTDIEVRLRDLGKGSEFSVTLLPRAAEVTYAGFPLRVRRLTGSVVITAASARIDLRGACGDAALKINGRFLFAGAATTTGPRTELWVKGTNLSFDSEIYTAVNRFDTDIGDFWRDLSPKGRFDTEVTLWRAPGAEDFSYDLHLQLKNASVEFTQLPMPVEKLTGDLFFHGEGKTCRCDLSPVRGEIHNGRGQPPASVLLQGTLLNLGSDLSADVTCIVQRLRLTDELGTALQKGGIVTEKLWSSLELDGFADVNAIFLRKPGQPDTERSFEIRLRDVSSTADLLPGTARDLHGEILVVGDQARFKKIEGKIDETKIVIFDGSVQRSGTDTVVEFTATANSFPIDERLANTMSGRMKQTFLDRGMRGRVRLNDVRVKFKFPDSGAAFESEFSGDIEARNLFMDVGLPGGQSLKHLTGTVTITKGSANANGGQMVGQLSNVQFELSRHQIHALNSEFALDTSKFRLHNLSFQAAGGTIQGGNSADSRCFEYEFTERGKIYAYLTYQNLKLHELLKNEALSHSKVRGTCNGKVIIHKLEGGDFLDMQASGDIGVHDGKLGTVPLFSAIYKHIKEDKRPQFTMGRVDFVMNKRKIVLSEFNVRSSLFKVEGKGTLDMDGYMDIDLSVPKLFGSAASLLILPPLLNEVIAKFARFKVYGYIRDPQIEHVMLFSEGFARQSLAPIPPVPVASSTRK